MTDHFVSPLIQCSGLLQRWVVAGATSAGPTMNLTIYNGPALRKSHHSGAVAMAAIRQRQQQCRL